MAGVVAMACNHCRQPRCRLCWLYDHDPRYRALWGGDATQVQSQVTTVTTPRPVRGIDRNKPKVSIDEMANKRRRCGEAKRAGLPCTEFQPPQPLPVNNERPNALTPDPPPSVLSLGESKGGVGGLTVPGTDGSGGHPAGEGGSTVANPPRTVQEGLTGVRGGIGPVSPPLAPTGPLRASPGAVVQVGGGVTSVPATATGATGDNEGSQGGGGMGGKVRWAYGVTTVPQRRGKLLPQTLASLKASGFDQPVLFVDGCDHVQALDYEREFRLPVVNRWPFIKTFGNWALALAELYIRNPVMDRYALFQDDMVCARNLRAYLDALPFPDGKGGRDKGYWNLYTFNFYANRVPRDRTVRREPHKGFYPSPTQQGLGALALVFDREGVWDVLGDRDNILTRPSHPNERSWKAVDGGIVEAMKRRGRKEMVHYPSLVQHTGHKSAMGNMRHEDAESFRGEDFDLLSLLPAGMRP